MGLLDRLVKRGISNTVDEVSRRAQNAASNTIGNAVENAVTSSIEKALGLNGQRPAKPAQSSQASQPAQQTTATQSSSYPSSYSNIVKLNVSHKEPFTPEAGAVGSSIANRGSAEYFEDVITKNVPGASIQKNVALSAISSENPKKQVKIDVLVNAGGKKLAILLVGKSRTRTHDILNTLNACEAAGVPAIRFIKEFRNEPGYVSARVKAVMK